MDCSDRLPGTKKLNFTIGSSIIIQRILRDGVLLGIDQLALQQRSLETKFWTFCKRCLRTPRQSRLINAGQNLFGTEVVKYSKTTIEILKVNKDFAVNARLEPLNRGAKSFTCLSEAMQRPERAVGLQGIVMNNKLYQIPSKMV